MLKFVTLLVLAAVSQNAAGFYVGSEDSPFTTSKILTTNTSVCRDIPLEVVFVMDSSGSVGAKNFTVMKEFVKSVIKRLNIGTVDSHAGVITFSGYPSLRIRLTDNLDEASLLKAVDAIPYIAGITETNTALDMLYTEAFRDARPGVARIGIVITDGYSFHQDATAASAKTAQNQGINLFAIGIGPEVNVAELAAIATNPDEQHVFRTNNFNSLSTIVDTLSAGTCKAQVIQTNTTVPTHIDNVTPAYINATQNATEGCNETLADIVFILDSSGSLSASNFQHVRQFVINIINNLDIGENLTRVGVITFSSYPIKRIDLGQFDVKLDLINAVNQIPYFPGSTATGAALRLALGEGFQGERPYAPNIAIVVTDGHSTSPKITKSAAAALKAWHATVFAIGVGLEIDVNELNYISSYPNSEYVFFVSNFTELYSIEKRVSKTTCEAPLVPSPEPETTTEALRTTLKPTTPTTTPAPTTPTTTTPAPTTPTTTQATTTGTTQPPCIAKVADVFFVIDSSGSVGEKNFDTMKTFMKRMIDVFDISFVFTRVGIITYNLAATMPFELNIYNTAAEVKQAIGNIAFTSGGTNTGIALEMLRVQGFNIARPGVPHIAIVITDGLSSDPIATKVQARLLKESGDVLIAIGVGNETNSEELKAIASVDHVTGKSLVYEVGSFQALQTLNNTVAYKTCSAVVVPSVATTPAVTQPSTTVCADSEDNCAAYGEGVCSDYKPWAMKHCRATCGGCINAATTPTPPCVDKIQNCFEYGSYICTQVSVSRWTNDNCRLYCKFCNV